jgi:hypothetical protein
MRDSGDSVTLECVDALTTISNSPSTVRLSLRTLCGLLKTSTDTNIRHAIVQRLGSNLYSSHRLEDSTQDLLDLLEHSSSE